MARSSPRLPQYGCIAMMKYSLELDEPRALETPIVRNMGASSIWNTGCMLRPLANGGANGFGPEALARLFGTVRVIVKGVRYGCLSRSFQIRIGFGHCQSWCARLVGRARWDGTLAGLAGGQNTAP